MSLKSMTLSAGATISTSGGTNQVFADDGQTIASGVHLVVPADADYQTRRQLTAKVRQPSLDPKTGAYTKDKKSISYVIPVVLASGQVVFNTLRIEREVHPSFSAANCTEMNKIGAQLLLDADTDGFWSYGSLT